MTGSLCVSASMLADTHRPQLATALAQVSNFLQTARGDNKMVSTTSSETSSLYSPPSSPHAGL
jgi:hypothetical protein